MGYYGGDGARKVATVTPSASLPQTQPACLDDPTTTGLTDCGNWAESASWAVPADAVSGIYFAKLVRDGGASDGSHIFFIVRDDDGHSNLLFQTQDTTWEAYNQYGGRSLYQSNDGGPGTNPARAYKVSYNRPLTTRGPTPEDSPFNAEYPMVRWLERNGYDVSYFTGVDSARFGSKILDHKTFLSVGHDEYWSATQRTNVEAARAAGVNLAFFAGNESFWKTRWEPSTADGSSTDWRTLVCYKETHAGAKIDPTPVWTGTWRDRRFSPTGRRRPSPRTRLTGTMFRVNSGTSAIDVPAADGKMRIWRNTSIASHAPGQTATLTDGTLGYEWDEAPDNGFRPAGAGAAFLDHEERRRCPPGLRLHLRLRHGDPPHDPVQGPERGARLRRRHDPVVLGARRKSRSRRLHPRPAHAAGDGQRARRHGRPARHAAGRPGRGYRLDRHGSPQLRDQLAA